MPTITKWERNLRQRNKDSAFFLKMLELKILDRIRREAAKAEREKCAQEAEKLGPVGKTVAEMLRKMGNV